MATADLTRPALGSRRADTWTPAERSAGVLDCAASPDGYDGPMRSAARSLAAMAVAVLVGACSASPGASATAMPTASPEATTPTAPASGPVETAAPTASAAPITSAPASAGAADMPSEPAPTPVGMTQTTWGRILNSVPAEFPVFPSAAVADPPPGGAVSGAWLSTASVSEVDAWYREALTAANWAKVDDGGALEDGSHVLDVQGDLPECKAQVTVEPAGGSTMIAVLYGAGCVGAGDG